MAKGKAENKRNGVRKPRTPAVIAAYSGSGYHSLGKYGKAERRSANREIRRELK